jgi:hypothetical protein
VLVRPVFAFFVVELGSRRVVHVGVTRSPTGSWAAHQRREATPEGTGPRFLVHDHDAKDGPALGRAAQPSRTNAAADGTPAWSIKNSM